MNATSSCRYSSCSPPLPCPALALPGIFRDTFPNVVELLDDLLRRAADAAEATSLNYVRKHALEMAAQGMEAQAVAGGGGPGI